MQKAILFCLVLITSVLSQGVERIDILPDTVITPKIIQIGTPKYHISPDIADSTFSLLLQIKEGERLILKSGGIICLLSGSIGLTNTIVNSKHGWGKPHTWAAIACSNFVISGITLMVLSNRFK